MFIKSLSKLPKEVIKNIESLCSNFLCPMKFVNTKASDYCLGCDCIYFNITDLRSIDGGLGKNEVIISCGSIHLAMIPIDDLKHKKLI